MGDPEAETFQWHSPWPYPRQAALMLYQPSPPTPPGGQHLVFGGLAWTAPRISLTPTLTSTPYLLGAPSGPNPPFSMENKAPKAALS